MLESVLSCDIQRYWITGYHQKPVLNVQIFESNLLTALTFGNKNGHHASVWHKKDTPSIPNKNSPQPLPFASHHPSEFNTIIILSWNSRGLTLSVPYIQSLLCEKPSVLVLSEHWLWPYELARLNDISDSFEATGKADSRLTEISNEGRGFGGRGFGGIPILWHKTIGAIPVSDITSDRICVIRFCDPNDNRSTVSVIGFYLPCSDQGMDCYRDHLQEFERVISDSVAPIVLCHSMAMCQKHLPPLDVSVRLESVFPVAS